MEIYRVNEHYIQEVVDASRKILRIVLEGLLPGDHLRHAPVRTYFRIFSAMIFILKVGSNKQTNKQTKERQAPLTITGFHTWWKGR